MNYTSQQELYGLSNYEVAAELGARFRAYRVALRLTQKDVAEKSGVSVLTISRFEKGAAPSISLYYYIALLRAIQQLERVADSIPEIPESLYGKRRAAAQRVRRKQDEK